MTHIGPQIAAAPSVDDDVAHMLAASAGSLPQHLADPKREWVCEWEGQGAGQWGGTHMTTNTLKLVINVYRYYGTRGASVSFVCLPWRKTFSQAPKKRTLPSAPSPLPTYPSWPPLKLVCRQWNANKSRWRNFNKMPRRASIYGRQVEILSQAVDQRRVEEGRREGRGRGSQPRTAAGQSYQHLLLLLSRAVSCQNCMFIAWFLALVVPLSLSRSLSVPFAPLPV